MTERKHVAAMCLVLAALGIVATCAWLTWHPRIERPDVALLPYEPVRVLLHLNGAMRRALEPATGSDRFSDVIDPCKVMLDLVDATNGRVVGVAFTGAPFAATRVSSTRLLLHFDVRSLDAMDEPVFESPGDCEVAVSGCLGGTAFLSNPITIHVVSPPPGSGTEPLLRALRADKYLRMSFLLGRGRTISNQPVQDLRQLAANTPYEHVAETWWLSSQYQELDQEFGNLTPERRAQATDFFAGVAREVAHGRDEYRRAYLTGLAEKLARNRVYAALGQPTQRANGVTP